MKRIANLLISVIVLGLAACTNKATNPPLDGDVASPIIEASGAATAVVPSPEPTEEPTPVDQLSYESILYRDEEGRFELAYPARWNEGYGERQSRGYFRTYFSWDPAVSNSIEFVPEGGTYVQIMVSIWDPINDVDAFVDWQTGAMEASGMEFLSKEVITLVDGGSGVRAVGQAANGRVIFFFWLSIGERYLSLTGEGDLELLTEIAGTVRILEGSD